MKISGGRNPTANDAVHPLPGPATTLLAATPQGGEPVAANLGPKLTEALEVTGNGMILEPSPDHAPQPRTERADSSVHPTAQLQLNRLQLGSQTLGDRLTLNLKRSLPSRPAVMRETQKVERLRFALPTLPSVFVRKASEFDQPRFLGMQLQAELRETTPQVAEESLGLVAMLESQDEVVGIADDDDVAHRRCL